MYIHRDQQVDEIEREERIEYVLDTLQDADGFNDDITWQTEVVENLTVEELIGALVGAEQHDLIRT